MRIEKTALPGVLILHYDLRRDARGEKTAVYSEAELAANGIPFRMTAENVYCPERAGTLYGIHMQTAPKAQAKIMSCVKGRGIDYAVDLRKDSGYFLRWVGVPLEADPTRQVYIPEGFGHVFLSLEDDTVVHMKVNADFDNACKVNIAWNDPDIGIEYPVAEPILISYDAAAPRLRELTAGS